MSKFGPQVRLEEMTPEDFANMQGKVVWVSVADVNEETGVTSKVRADVVGRVSVISRVEDLWDDDTYKFDIGFYGAENDAFTATLPDSEGRTVMIASELNSWAEDL